MKALELLSGFFSELLWFVVLIKHNEVFVELKVPVSTSCCIKVTLNIFPESGRWE